LAVLTVVFVLVLLLVITRIVQRSLETELLPHTGSSRASRTSTHNLLLQTAGGAIG
jgi:small-conductance mechanosensitive channel